MPPVRIAEFNLALYGKSAGDVRKQLETGDEPRIQRLAEIIQRAAPDIILLSEIDYDEKGEVVDAFCDKYLAVGQNASGSAGGAAKPIEFPHRYWAPTNTGEHSGLDLDKNGRIDPKPETADFAGDCYGYGRYPGQYGFALLSKYPIEKSAIRTFRTFRWAAMPGARLPDDPATPAPGDWYPADVLGVCRLSSKNHCDVPVKVADRRIHLLLAHPTPPVYDGAEDRNGRRNFDELRMWVDYVGDPAGSAYLVDDNGVAGGLAASESFVILGDLNGDPNDGDGPEGISVLLAAPRVLRYPAPRSEGAAEQAKLQGGANDRHKGDPAEDTCDPADDPGPGNLRLDYVLPSADLRVATTGVFWPKTDDPLFPLTAGAAEPASSDHRLVWADVTWEATGAPAPATLPK